VCFSWILTALLTVSSLEQDD